MTYEGFVLVLETAVVMVFVRVSVKIPLAVVYASITVTP